MKQLVRIESSDRPAAPLLLPRQQYFLRENLRLRLLSARIALSSHDDASFRADVDAADGVGGQIFRHAREVRAGAAGDAEAARRHAACAASCPIFRAASTRCACCAFRTIVRPCVRPAPLPRADVPAVRILFWFLLLAAAAVGVALAAKVVNGYALFVAPPYRVELSLNLLLLLLVAGFVGGYALLRLALRTAALPRDVRALRRRHQEARSRAKSTRRSSRCSKDGTARHGNAPRKASVFRARRVSPRWWRRGRRSTPATSRPRKPTSPGRHAG